MFSVVIPTIWKYPPFLQMLADLDRFHLVDEVLVFDNNPDHKPNTSHLSRGKISFTRDSVHENIMVNPVWNWGVEKARNERILILNDDLQFSFNVFYRVQQFMDDTPNCGAIGFAPGDHPIMTKQPPTTTGVVTIIPHTNQHKWGFGEMIVIRKSTWVPIPDDMKLFYGDDWLYETNKLEGRTNYIITDSLWNTPHSVSSRSFVSEYEVPDRQAYQKHMALLRTSYE